MCFSVEIGIDTIKPVDFEKFLRIRKGLGDKTIETYVIHFKKFLRFLNGRDATKEIIEDYLGGMKSKRNDYAMLKALFRDYLENDIVGKFKIPKSHFQPKILPNKSQLRIFYDVLPEKIKPLFLFLASSGLRITEALSLQNIDIDFDQRMVIPKSHTGQTKHSWVTFYNDEVGDFNTPFGYGKDYVARLFKQTSIKTGISIHPHLLRSIFAREMALKGVLPQYVDGFCGRIPQSVLSRNYTDYSPETLKTIYLKANIKILE
jgi:integrase